MTSPIDDEPAREPAPAAKRKRFARLRKWSWRVLLLGVVARVLLAVFLEPLANFGAGFAGLTVSWRSASLSLLGLSLHIQDLVVADAADDEAPPLLMAHDLTASLSLRDLVHGQLTVIDVALAGARVTVEQRADGQLRLPAAWTQPAAIETPVVEAPDDAPLSFELPARISSLRVHDLRLELIDGQETPPRQHIGTVDVDITDIGFADRVGSVVVRLHVPQVCDELFVAAELETAATRATASWRGAVRGLRPRRFDLPLDIVEAIDGAHIVDLTVDGNITAEVLPAAPGFPALQGSCDLQLALDGIERMSLQAACGPAMPIGPAGAIGADNPTAATGGLTMPFALTLQTNDLVEQLVLDAGRVDFRDEATTITTQLRVTGLTGRRFQPLLADAGLVLPSSGLDLQADLDAEFGESLSLSVDQLTASSAGEQLLDLKRLAVHDLRSNGDALAIGAVELLGPDLTVHREADGTFVLAGVRFPPPTGAAADGAEEEPATTADTESPPRLPELRLGSLQWSGARIELRDATTSPTGVLAIDDVRLRADGITIGADAPPGRLSLSMRLPGIAERIGTELRLTSAADGFSAQLELRATGLTGGALVPWLEPLGLRSELTAGTLACDVDADLRLRPAGFAGELHVAKLKLADGDQTLLSLDRLDGTGVRVAADDFAIGSWTITQPFAFLHRDDEAFYALGMRFADAAGSPAEPPPNAPDAAPAATGADNRRRLQVPDLSNPRLRHGPLRVEGARVTFRNDLRPERIWQIGLDVSLGDNDGSGAALPLTATVSLPGILDSCELGGTLVLTPARSEIDARLAVSGIRGEGLEGLLPPGTTCTLTDGTFETMLDATLATSPDNTAIDASVRGVRLLDGDTELAAIDEIELQLPHLRPKELHVRSARVAGLRALVALTPDGLQLPGLTLASPTDASSPTSTSPAAATDDGAAARANRAPMELGKLQLDALSVAIERIVIHDRRGAEAEPLVLQAQLQLREPWLGQPSSNQPTAMTFDISGDCQPLGAQLTADLAVTPFALLPTLAGSFAVRGFDTTRLADVAPALAQQLGGDATALELTAELHGQINLKRRDPAFFDFGRVFAAELVVENVVLRDAATDRTLASVKWIDAVVRAIDPQTGAVLLRSLDVDEPMFKLERREDGLHVAGFLLPPNPPATADGDGPPPAAGDGSGDAELAIDRVRVYGIDFDFRDATTTPPTHLSLADSDVEVQRFSTRLTSEPRTMSFTAALRGGDVELPERVVGSSLIGGILGSAADIVTGGAGRRELELRPMVDQITVNGQISVHPVLRGHVQAEIDDLELTAFRGLASASGVNISDGLYDARIDLDIKGYDGIVVRSRHVLSYLGLSEPADGPISNYLRLPAPLQTVLFLLRNNDGEQRLPLMLRIPTAGLSGGDIADLVAEALTRIITASVGSAPGRLASTITGVLFGGETSVPDVTAEAGFEPGSPLPAQLDFDGLLAAAEEDASLTIVLHHELGAADLEHARELANPPQAVVLATVQRLQSTRRELIARRGPIARDVVALYGASKTQEALRRQTELLAVDTRLGELETTLAQTLGMLDEESQRVVQRRTRAAAVELAEARLDAVVAELRERHPDLGDDRFDRRTGRGMPVTGLTEGRVLASLRRRSGPLDTSMSVPPVVDTTENAFNKPFAPDWLRGPYDHDPSFR